MSTVKDVYARCCTTRFPLPNESEIESLESRLEMRFPDRYRKYLLSYNGGFFSNAVIVFPEPITVQWRDGEVTHKQDIMEQMYGLHSAHPYAEIGRESDINLFDDNKPIQLLPVGRTIMGSLLLLDMLQGHEGEILIKFPSEGAYPIADNIDELFDLIEPQANDQ